MILANDLKLHFQVDKQIKQPIAVSYYKDLAMKFSPCKDQCTKDGTICQGCGRSHTEIKESKALVGKVVAHLDKYGYEDPEKFLEMLNNKSLKKSAKLQGKKRK